jgi:hypothetical protein
MSAGRSGIVRFDERSSAPQNRGMDDDLFDVLRSYPQIYFACHTAHRTRAS